MRVVQRLGSVATDTQDRYGVNHEAIRMRTDGTHRPLEDVKIHKSRIAEA
jgi:hypothetical protein